MNLEEEVNQTDRTISMHSATVNQRQQEFEFVQENLLLTQAERMLCASPEINRTDSGTFGSERENSGFSV